MRESRLPVALLVLLVSLGAVSCYADGEPVTVGDPGPTSDVTPDIASETGGEPAV